MSFTELSQVHNVHISNDYYLWQASPRSTLSLARTSPKAANIHNRWWRERSERNLRFHSNIIKTSSKRANIGNNSTACLCSPSSRTILPSFMGPQASLPAAAQPAVMDVRRLRRRSGKRQSRARRRSGKQQSRARRSSCLKLVRRNYEGKQSSKQANKMNKYAKARDETYKYPKQRL